MLGQGRMMMVTTSYDAARACYSNTNTSTRREECECERHKKVSVLKATIYGKSVRTAALMVVVLYVGQDLGECPKLCRVAEL